MQNIFLRRFLCFLTLILIVAGQLKAQFEEGQLSRQIGPISCDNLGAGPKKVYFTPVVGSTQKITNILRFRFNEKAQTGDNTTPYAYYKSAFKATAHIHVDEWLTVPTGSEAADNQSDVTLDVNYDPAPGAKYTPVSYILLSASQQYQQVVVTVNNVTFSQAPTGWTQGDVLPLLTVENEMDVLRYYAQPVLAAPSSLPDPIYDAVNHSDQVAVTWSFPSGNSHNMAQLEYAWVENETKGFYNKGGSFDASTLFRANSTRIDIDLNPANTYSYNVPLLYPADPATGGTLYYRVRAVMRRNDGSLIAGPWSTEKSFSNAGHEPGMNWQVSTTFAENGKSKTVIQYFDGTLRPRQTVTKDNVTGNTTVGETIYDRQGRPNVQILPTPTLSTAIQYFRDFNRFEGQTGNDDPSAYFDLAVAGNLCVGSPALQKDRGNGQYYSPDNPWIGTEPTARLVPDANGYGYSETRYTDDPTARISSQGGIGQAHQIGSGHETKYFYSKPGQDELDALFGTEVGDATHYFKNMVQDANGQMSISYVDMHGRTVATSLTGDAPGSVASIKDNMAFYPTTSARITNDLVTPQNNVVKDNAIESVSTLAVPWETSYNFTYSLTPAVLQMAGCQNQTICYDCKYDLEIEVKPEGCTEGETTIKHFNNLSIAPPGQECSPVGFTGDGLSNPATTVSFSVPLKVGSWTVRKTLTIDEASFTSRRNAAADIFLCKTQQELEDEIFATLSAASNCATPRDTRYCNECQAKLGSYTDYRNRYIADAGGSTAVSEATIHDMYVQESQECSNACGLAMNPAMTTLGSIRAQMLADMIPVSGQYGVQGVASTDFASRFNIFSTSSSFGNIRTRPYYRTPVSEPDGTGTFYANPDGTPDASIYPDNNGSNPATLNLLSADDYTSLFNRNWAGDLIYYHPEYSRLHFAETTLATSYAWLDNVLNCTTYADASSKGYLSPLSSDPYFTYQAQGYVPADKTLMTHYLTSDINPSGNSGNSIWRIANASVLVDPNEPGALQQYDMSQLSSTGIDPSAVTDAQKDAVWQAFIGGYLRYRNDMVVNYINAQKAGDLSSAQMDLLNQSGKILHFVTAKRSGDQNGVSWWGAATNSSGIDVTTLTSQANGYATSNAPDHCAAQRILWRARLLQCEQLQQYLLSQTQADADKVNTIINSILDQMVTVCQNSIDASHPDGASNVNPALMPMQPNNFEDIINQVFAANGIATLPGNNYFCNPYSVDYPKPYNNTPAQVENRSAYLDQCNCSQFASIKADAQAAGYDITSFSSMNAYLQATYGDVLTLPVWQGLQLCSGHNFNPTRCIPGGGGGQAAAASTSNVTTESSSGGTTTQSSSSSGSCYTYYQGIYLGQYVAIPAFLGCGYIKPCVTCTTLANYTTAFRTLYPDYSGVPFMGDIDESQASANALWARYLNFKTGMNKTAADYAPAYTSCATNGVAPAWLQLTDRTSQPPSSSPSPALYIAKDSIVFAQEYTSLDTDEFETLLSSSVSGGSGAYALCDLAKPFSSDMPTPDPVDPCQDARDQAKFMAQLIIQQRRDYLMAIFDQQYRAQCLNAQHDERFYATYQPKEYHFTLYYYDQAGNLLKTLPPAAVRPNYDPDYLANVKHDRDANIDHTNGTNIENMATQYRYNSLNGIVAQQSPDGGRSQFWYDRLGRLAVSQNARQAGEQTYSYTLYDGLGRITEVGQKPQDAAMSQTISQDPVSLSSWLNDVSASHYKQQITRTVYDVPYPGFTVGNPPLTQLNLRNRVSYTQVFDLENVSYRAATYYSYDIHGNVDKLLQDYGTSGVMGSSPNQFKLIKYDYDLISGKVNQVSYQPGQADAFYHQYTYDAENRITGVRTSRDLIEWQNDASYQYYRHGPLARVELGELKVQGIDYAYTLQGWLKSVNPSWNNVGGDLFDGDGTGSNPLMPRDAYKFNLHYFDDGVYTDYTPVSAPTGYVQGNTLPLAARNNLYNGNINSMAVNIRPLTTSTPMIYNYKYDQLNRISSMDAWAANGSFGPTGSAPMRDYAERYSYDPNGNILKLRRYGYGSNYLMDDMTYQYQYVKTNNGGVGEYIPGQALPGDVDHLTNRLSSIGDIQSTGYDDVQPQTPFNYQYDAIGNLVNDGTSTITWNVYGKILTITKEGQTISYTYDASGNRISKKAGGITTWYVRDASGNVMATYVQGDNTKNGGVVTQSEVHVYGSSRLGILNLNVNCGDLSAPASGGVERGSKLFELTNHLGNVLVTVTDKKVQHSAGGSTVDYYTADVASASDYYPFGMQMPGRAFNSGGYRYGFNGKENDNEVKGVGNQIDYGMRVYDPRVGRFMSVDPLDAEYPAWGPYAYAMNRPIDGIDLDGAEWQPVNKDGKNVSADSKDIAQYIWKGYDKDGNAAKGTVESGVVNSPKGYKVWYTSNKESHSGMATYMSEGSSEWTTGDFTHQNGRMPYNVSVEYHDNWNQEGFTSHKTTTVNVFGWNDEGQRQGYLNTFNNNMGVNPAIFNSPNKFFDGIRHGLSFLDGPPGMAITAIYPETIFLPLPKGLSLFGRVAETTADGFWYGSIGFKLPFSVRVGLYASENTLKYGTFKWSTIAPGFLSRSEWFGRRMLQITSEFQPVLGKWSTQVIPKGTFIKIGLVGPQKGMGFGTWLQIYAPKAVRFVK